jgi:hypothetical protein
MGCRGCSGWPAATPSSSLGAAGRGRWRPRPPAARQHAAWGQPGPALPALPPATSCWRLVRRQCLVAVAPRAAVGTAGGSGAAGGPAWLTRPCLPTKRERACDQRPVPADGPIRANLEVGPTELTLDLLVALLDPVPQPIQPHHLGQVGPLGAAAGRSSQVGQQIPSCCARAARPGRWWRPPAAAADPDPSRPVQRRLPTRRRCGHRGSAAGCVATGQASWDPASRAHRPPRPEHGPPPPASRCPCEAEASTNRTLAAPRASVKPELSP